MDIQLHESNQPTGLLESAVSRDLAGDCRRLIRMRWLAGALMLLGTVFCTYSLSVPLPEWPLYGLGIALLAYNAVLGWVMAHRHPQASSSAEWTRQFILWQVALDWLALALFLHFTGGIASPAKPVLVIHILMVAALLPGQRPYLYMVVGTSILGAIAVLEAAGTVRHYMVLPSDLYRSPIYILAEITFFAITALVGTYLISVITTHLRERERQVVALLDTIESATSSLDLPDVLEAIARSGATALGATKSAVRLLNEAGDRLDMTAAYGLSESYKDKGPVELAHSPLDREAMNGHAVIVQEAQSDPRIQYPREVAEEGIRSLLVVPIQGQAHVLGVLRIYADTAHRFSDADAAFATLLAREAASAIQNAQTHDALRQTEQARAQFVRTVTHELRAPVGAVQSLLRTLLRGLVGELSVAQIDILQRMEQRLDGLMQLISDLLAMAASSSVDLDTPAVPVLLADVLQRAIDQIRQQADEKRIMLRLDLPDRALKVLATEDGLQRVIDNLVNNAVKYTGEGGHICVQMTEQTGQAVITIEDSGIGIPAEDLAHLCEPFYRARNAREAGIPGTGLGLTIVKRLVDSFGGTLSIQSAEQKGTALRIVLPLTSIEQALPPSPH